MKKINLDSFDYLFIKFAGGSDTEEFDHMDFNFNDNDNRRNFIKKELQPFFQSNFSDFQKNDLLALLTFIIDGNKSIEKHLDRSLYPFMLPKDEFSFYKDIKDILYDSANYYNGKS
jgi:hypothetical protein